MSKRIKNLNLSHFGLTRDLDSARLAEVFGVGGSFKILVC